MLIRIMPFHLVAILAVPGMVVTVQEARAGAAAPQSKPEIPNSPTAVVARKSAGPKSANVKNGVVSALDAAAGSLTLREATGKTDAYVLTAKTRYNRNRRPAQLSDFKIADSIVLRFRKSRADGALQVSEIDDPASRTFLSEIRKATTPAVVKEISENTLSVTTGTDHIPLDYTISDKTRWQRAGKEVKPGAFHSGDRVYVVPRSLPSGAIMARAVADTTSGAAQEKERLATSVHGTIVSVDPAAHKLILKTLSGDTRSLAFADDIEFIAGGKPQALVTLRSGLHVVARIRHETRDEEIVWRVTVETSKKTNPVRSALQRARR